MRDKTHIESLEKWAEYVKTHKDWKKLHTAFIDAQYEKSNLFYTNIGKTKNGKIVMEKLKKEFSGKM